MSTYLDVYGRGITQINHKPALQMAHACVLHGSTYIANSSIKVLQQESCARGMRQWVPWKNREVAALHIKQPNRLEAFGK